VISKGGVQKTGGNKKKKAKKPLQLNTQKQIPNPMISNRREGDTQIGRERALWAKNGEQKGKKTTKKKRTRNHLLMSKSNRKKNHFWAGVWRTGFDQLGQVRTKRFQRKSDGRREKIGLPFKDKDFRGKRPKTTKIQGRVENWYGPQECGRGHWI